ncbi:MAG TPA: guanylate kinase [Thermomicrobiales bacterium]|nr:guanylate kinase [Thermomicrobiales bacterium]
MVSPAAHIVRDGDAFIAQLRQRRRPRVFIISGPSGVGKDAVIERLRDSEEDTHFAITATTRPMRENEVDKVHYYFVTPDRFEDWIETDQLLEHAQVYSHQYGVPKEPVRAALALGQDVIIKIDVQGAASLRRLMPEAISIFLAPESMERLFARLSARKSDDAEALARRFAEAGRELQRAHEFDYVVFNETNGILRAVADIRAILLAERERLIQPSIAL